MEVKRYEYITKHGTISIRDYGDSVHADTSFTIDGVGYGFSGMKVRGKVSQECWGVFDKSTGSWRAPDRIPLAATLAFKAAFKRALKDI
jgi:hypothetical protein